MISFLLRKCRLTFYKGEGEADTENEWVVATKTIVEPTSPAEATSLAPQGRPVGFSKFRRKPPPLLNLEVPRSKGMVARLQESYSVSSPLPKYQSALLKEVNRVRCILDSVEPKMHISLNSSDISSSHPSCSANTPIPTTADGKISLLRSMIKHQNYLVIIARALVG